jgi:spermidine synthase
MASVELAPRPSRLNPRLRQQSADGPAPRSGSVLVGLFFLSGFAALIYQIVWQRVLFASFGVNIESVTITVSLFMFGLGVGSLVGGVLSRRFPEHAPRLFLICELGIGLFGLVSIPLIHAVSALTLHGSLLGVSLAIYALLSLPTIGMGATLPILVNHLNRHYANVGKSVGTLYCVNTLGSAVACFLTADVLFAFFGQQTAVYFAASCNFAVALLVVRLMGRAPASTAKSEIPNPKSEVDNRELGVRISGFGLRIADFVPMLLLAAATGYISLSQEILWFRAISYVTGGKPDVFAYLLGFLLLGVAGGARLAQRVCETRRMHPLPFIAMVLSLSGAAYYVSIPLSAWVLTMSSGLGLLTCYAAVTVVALLIGSVFPVACHQAIRSESATGLLLSLVYFANIVGATAGPLLTGFILLDLYAFEHNIFLLSKITLAIAALVWLACRGWQKACGTIGIAAALAVLFLVHDGLYARILEKLHYQTDFVHKAPYKYLVQNRTGIIAVEAGPPDMVYGGAIYDGRFNTDPVNNANFIRRAYLIAALHPDPKEVLEIGLSSGSWARVVADHAAVEHLTSIEINAGYLDLIGRYSEIASLLDDPKVTLCVDDGRRWLNRHPERKFDFILMNNSFHWRDQATNLLSADFLRICQQHLNPGGVIYFNSTGSEDVVYTAATVFRHVTRYLNFVAAGDTPFAMAPEQRHANLLRFRRDGKLVFDPTIPELRVILDELANSDLEDEAPAYRSRTDLFCITDENMACEYRRCRKWFPPARVSGSENAGLAQD